jgi:hypothetical protein
MFFLLCLFPLIVAVPAEPGYGARAPSRSGMSAMT